MAALVAAVSALTAALTVYLGVGLWAALGFGHSGMFGLFVVFAVLYALGIVLGSLAGFAVIRRGAAGSREARLRGLAILAVAAATVGSAGYFIGWFSGVLPSLA